MTILGSELVTNGDFANWTADDPDNWELMAAETGSQFVTENPAGEAQIITAGALMGLKQDIGLVAGARYKLVIDAVVANGSLTIGNSPPFKGLINSTGTGQVFYFIAGGLDGTFILFKRTSGVTDVTIDNVSIKEVITFGGKSMSMSMSMSIKHILQNRNK